jgi:hypothetical protein
MARFGTEKPCECYNFGAKLLSCSANFYKESLTRFPNSKFAFHNEFSNFAYQEATAVHT